MPVGYLRAERVFGSSGPCDYRHWLSPSASKPTKKTSDMFPALKNEAGVRASPWLRGTGLRTSRNLPSCASIRRLFLGVPNEQPITKEQMLPESIRREQSERLI